MSNLIVKESAGKGRGVFAASNFEKNQVIFRFNGKLLYRKDIEDFTSNDASNYLQINKNIYVNLEGDLSFFGNHSCNPNMCVRISVNTAFATAIRPINANEELTYDYSTTCTEDVDTWSMKCACSIYSCRGLITGFHSVPEKRQIELFQMGAVPNYVKEHYKL